MMFCEQHVVSLHAHTNDRKEIDAHLEAYQRAFMSRHRHTASCDMQPHTCNSSTQLHALRAIHHMPSTREAGVLPLWLRTAFDKLDYTNEQE